MLLLRLAGDADEGVQESSGSFYLQYDQEMMDLEGLELYLNGESYPNDCFEILHYDFISQWNEDEWAGIKGGVTDVYQKILGQFYRWFR